MFRIHRFMFHVSCFMSLIGCTITDTSIVNTGLYGGDLDGMYAGYKKVKKMDKGRSTITDVECAGFLVQHENKTPNVELITGAAAFRRIFSDNVYQGALAQFREEQAKKAQGDKEVVKKTVERLLDEVENYELYIVPFKVIVTETDRYYFSTKETIRKGDDLTILILFDGEKFVHIDCRHIKIDTRDSTSAFAQGVIDILKEYLGPASALNDFMNKIRDQIKPPSN